MWELIYFKEPYRRVLLSPALIGLSFVFSFDSPVHPHEVLLWKPEFPFLVFYKTEQLNEAWCEVKNKFLFLSASNYYRLAEAKACLSDTWLLGHWPYVLGRAT